MSEVGVPRQEWQKWQRSQEFNPRPRESLRQVAQLDLQFGRGTIPVGFVNRLRLQVEDLPPRFQWIWYVKKDILKSVFGLSLPSNLHLRLSSPASSGDDDISMADPSETSGTPRPKLADFEADWLKDAFGADFVDEFEAAASPLGHSPSDSGSSDRPLAEKSSSERPPEETKKTSKRKLPASAESAPVAPKKKKREIKLGPVSVGSYDRASSMKPSGSRILKNKPSSGTRVPEREHPMDTDFLGDTTPAPVLTVNPALTIGTFPADDANSSISGTL
ncbi:hypothetical protein K435DRAFT_866390 [Dendrothele bispora CBS 962.96]|uniref:Uncharacterized protein n=1 Tax=Dendrothele bispora (strain CBS 962.96) TaxID=1314807 RepID=A0A4S8LH99_DENBC|nr:hypothetical protein K435DRAFT_866390 [Dendrothele bispora CBS 962.96]